MYQSDVQMGTNVEKVFTNIHTINIEVISEIQKEIEPYDNISLVFLLYDNPNTALERLIVYQRVAKDEEARNMNLLCDWTQHAQARNSWKYEFLEALAVCQLYSIIRKLGFNIQSIKDHYRPDNIYTSVYLHPMKKALYKLCENITSSNLVKLQRTLETYEIGGIKEYEAFELCLLELMCQKFITVDVLNNGKCPQNVENLTNIIRNIPDLKHFSVGLLELQNKLNGKPTLNKNTTGTSTIEQPVTIDIDKSDKGNHNDKMYIHDLQDVMNLIGEIEIENDENIKSDKKIFNKKVFEIKNPKRLGVCYIINQENFHLSKVNIESNTTLLDDRLGSTRDKKFLKKTMRELNFEVICHDNLDHKQMLQYLSDIVKYRVQYDDSIFMLCILSHGVKDHVFAADCIKVNVYDHIQKLLDSDEMPQHIHEMPKILIIQACQVIDEAQKTLVADAPTLSINHVKKSEFLIYWATAPEFEAFRDENKGSIFIQFLCCIIRKYGRVEDVNDIFTRVNACVKRISQKLKFNQVAIFNNSLTKKLYFYIPNQKA